MAHVQRHLRGDTNPWSYPVASATVIEVGDFIFNDSGYAKPISDMSDAGDAAANREWAADNVVGVALTGSADGETTNVTVASTGVFQLTQQTAAAIDIGDPVGIYADADACSDQLVVEDSTSPIGYCVETKSSTSDTTVKVELRLTKNEAVNS